MSNIGNRLDRLEKITDTERPRIIWIEADESPDQALCKAAPLAPGEVPVFCGWASKCT